MRPQVALFLMAAAIAFAVHGEAGPGDPPKSLGDLKLMHALRGQQALGNQAASRESIR